MFFRYIIFFFPLSMWMCVLAAVFFHNTALFVLTTHTMFFLQYLESVHPLLDSEKYKQMEFLASDFKNTKAAQLQRYLILKSWWATNYVSRIWSIDITLGLKFRCVMLCNKLLYFLGKWLVGGVHLPQGQEPYHGQQ